MLRNLSVSINRKLQDKPDHIRKSSDRQCPSPLSDEDETVGYRYYRSAEFQQALLRQDDDYTSLFDFGSAHEDACRRSRYERRKSAIITKIPFFHPESGGDNDRETAVLPEVSNQARWSTYTSGTSATSSSRHSTEIEVLRSPQAEKRSKRASIMMEGFDHLVAFAKIRKSE